MANELGRKAVEEMYIPQLTQRNSNIQLATRGPNFVKTALGNDGQLFSRYYYIAMYSSIG